MLLLHSKFPQLIITTILHAGLRKENPWCRIKSLSCGNYIDILNIGTWGLNEEKSLRGVYDVLLQGASVLKMSKANFEGNTAIVSEMISGKLGLAGGALFSTGSVQIQLDSSDFFKNEAESSGGAMAIHVNASDRRAPGILLRGVEFRSNAAGDLGGAIAVQVISLIKCNRGAHQVAAHPKLAQPPTDA